MNGTEEALKIVGDYADVMWQTGDMRDRDTMQYRLTEGTDAADAS